MQAYSDPKRMPKPGHIIRGFGLHNAGRTYLVLAVKDGRIRVEGPSFKSGNARFWDSPRWYLDAEGNTFDAAAQERSDDNV